MGGGGGEVMRLKKKLSVIPKVESLKLSKLTQHNMLLTTQQSTSVHTVPPHNTTRHHEAQQREAQCNSHDSKSQRCPAQYSAVKRSSATQHYFYRHTVVLTDVILLK